MKGSEDIEAYLMRLDTPFESLGPDMWNLQIQEDQNLVISAAGPVVVFRLKMMDVPPTGRETFYETLLTLNTTELVHGAFGLEAGSVVIVCTLVLENLDFNEFQATVDDISLSVGKLFPLLSRFRSST